MVKKFMRELYVSQ